MRRKRRMLGWIFFGIFLLANMQNVSVFAEESSASTAQEFAAESEAEVEYEQDEVEVSETEKTVYTDDSLARMTTAEFILICLLAVIILAEIAASTVIIILILKKPRGLIPKEYKEGGEKQDE